MDYLRCQTITGQIAGWACEAELAESAYSARSADNSIQNFDTSVSYAQAKMEKSYTFIRWDFGLSGANELNSAQ